MINNMLRSERCPGADLSSLRVCLSAGEVEFRYGGELNEC